MWKRTRRFFKDSETIFVARLQVAVGVIAVVLSYIDPQVVAPVFPAAWVPWLVVAHGISLEYLRRRRAYDLDS